jgi:hypothetical protein
MLFVERIWDSFYAWAFGFGGLAAVIGFVILALWYFTPPFLSSISARAMLLNIGLGCIAFAFVSGYYTTVGYNKCVATVEAGNRAAIEGAASSVKARALCTGSGGTWDTVSGSCMAKSDW